MALRELRVEGDPVLLQTAASVSSFNDDLAILVKDMFKTMYDAPGRGLAAPQVGVLKRIFVMDITWKDGPRTPMVCINPEVTVDGATDVTSDEGCLSIPGIMVPVRRPSAVTMAWTDLDGARHSQWFDGFAGLCIQHETDHLNGIVTLDRVDPALRGDLIAEFEAAP